MLSSLFFLPWKMNLDGVGTEPFTYKCNHPERLTYNCFKETGYDGGSNDGVRVCEFVKCAELGYVR